MKHLRILSFTALAVGLGFFTSCDDGEDVPTVIPPSESGLIEIQGGGAEYPNTSFIELKSGNQLAIARESWDLAFSSGSEFKVLINGTTGAMASATGKTDLNEVGAKKIAEVEDSGELILTFTNLQSILHVDNESNPLSAPVIAAINATEDQNEVYILSRGSCAATERSLKKIRIIRNGKGYTLQHADADSTAFSSLDIPKSAEDKLVYVSFEKGIVDVEPSKTAWDISWTAGTSTAAFPQAVNGTLAYFYQDLVYHNIYGGSSAAVMMEEDIAYESFEEQDAASLEFNKTDRMTIGSSWRNGSGPPGSPAATIKNNIYYIVKDAEANLYKVQFLSLTKDGVRGTPTFQYELVAQGN
jgi:hypothetical protein